MDSGGLRFDALSSSRFASAGKYWWKIGKIPKNHTECCLVSIWGLKKLEPVENQSVRSISQKISRFRHTRRLHKNEVGFNRQRACKTSSIKNWRSFLLIPSVFSTFRLYFDKGFFSLGLVSKIFVLDVLPSRWEVIFFDSVADMSTQRK